MRLSRFAKSLHGRLGACLHPDRIQNKYNYSQSYENLRPYFAPSRHVTWEDVHTKSPESIAFVAGNGPSLTQTLQQDFPQAEWIVCNRAYRIPELMARKPAWWVWGDPMNVWREDVVQSFRAAPQDSTFVFGRAPLDLPEEARNIRHIRISASQKLLDKFHNPKSSAALSPIRDVGGFYAYRHSPMVGIQLALWLGYKTIILVGAEHDYAVRQLLGPDSVYHAYEEDSSDRESLEQLSFLKFAHEVRLTWGMYAGLNNLADKMGAMIVDATPGGSLDVFRRTTVG